MTKLLEAALTYAQMGLPIFPCDQMKAPMVPNGVHAATIDTAKIHKWWTQWPDANIGCHLGEANLMAYDLDPGSDTDALCNAIGGWPKGIIPTQNTPREGAHLFFEVPNGIKIAPSAGKVSPHVDIRSHGSYVLLAPSSTADGEYFMPGKSMERLANCPMMTGEMVASAQIAVERHPEADEWIIEPDMPENVTLAREWLKHDAKIATEHQDGDHVAYATAAMMRSYGISEDVAVAMMAAWWDCRNNPPWGAEAEEFFAIKARNAYGSYATSPPGNMTAAYRKAKQKAEFKPRTEAGDTYLDLFRVADRAAIRKISKPDWLVHDMIHVGGHCLLYGSFSTYKTFLALDIALPLSVTKPVVFFAGEGRSGIRHRIDAWEQHHKKEANKILLIDPVPALLHQDKHEALAKALFDKHGPFALVVFDTVGRAMLGGNENSQEDAAKFTAALGLFARELKCATLSLHHSGKQGDQARGSSVFPADADTVIRVETEGDIVTLHMTKQKDAEAWAKPRRHQLIKVGPSLVVTDAPPEDQRKRERDQQATRDDIERYAYHALRSKTAITWSVQSLSIAMRSEPINCPVSMSALKKAFSNDRGWLRRRDSLQRYRNKVSQKWETPSKLPPRNAKLEELPEA